MFWNTRFIRSKVRKSNLAVARFAGDGLDLVIDGLAEEVTRDWSTGEAEGPHEGNPGAFVPLNDDFDEADPAATDPQPDFETEGASADDDELVHASLVFTGSHEHSGWMLDYPADELRVYEQRRDESTGALTLHEVEPGVAQPPPDQAVVNLRIEGLAVFDDFDLKAILIPPDVSGGAMAAALAAAPATQPTSRPTDAVQVRAIDGDIDATFAKDGGGVKVAQAVTANEREEDNPGIGIRRFGPEPGGSQRPDAEHRSTVSISRPTDRNLDPGRFRWRRSNTKVELYDDITQEPIFAAGETDARVTPYDHWVSGGNAYANAAMLESGAAQVSLVYLDGATDVVIDTVTLKTFKSMIIAVSGETRSGGNALTNGLVAVVKDLTEKHHQNVAYYDPAFYADAKADILKRMKSEGIEEVAIFGHSHGGGAVWYLANEVTAAYPAVAIKDTRYVDATEFESVADPGVEIRRPPGSQWHVSYYQLNEPLHGFSTVGGDINTNVNAQPWGVDLVHGTIEDSREVQQMLINGINTNINPF